jgi:dTDP-glucose 4,6-dehydratase
MKKILITGGAGFIGSHVVRRFVRNHPNDLIVNLDALTYAGNLANVADVSDAPNYRFERVDITDAAAVDAVFDRHGITHVVHLAAESHVDRSITDPMAFVRTNVIGTVNLLNAARTRWQPVAGVGHGAHAHADLSASEVTNLFYHVSTDEVYGSLGDEGFFLETTPYDPQSPYSASKAASDHFVRAYANTYKLPVVVSNCSNNYGPYQFPEKLVPLIIHNIKNRKPLPVYGKGENIRDWLFVVDHAIAIETVFLRGHLGETYNIGGHNEWKNIDVVRTLCRIMDTKLGRAPGESEELITFVKDRAGHDHRYAIDAGKIERELGWVPSVTFEQGMDATIDWYLDNQEWLDNVTSGAYQQYYDAMYAGR